MNDRDFTKLIDFLNRVPAIYFTWIKECILWLRTTNLKD